MIDQINSGRIIPNNFYTEKNAIILNCKDPSFFHKIYEETIKKHFDKEVIVEQQAVL